MNSYELYQKLIEAINNKANEELEDSSLQIDPSQIWESLFKIAETSPHIIPQFIQLLTRLSFADESPIVDSQVKLLQDATNKEDKEKQFVKLLLLISFIDVDNSITIFDQLVSYIESEYKNLPKVPKFLVDFTKKCHVDVQPSIYKIFLKKFDDTFLENELNPAISTAFALFVNDESLPIKDKIIKLLTSNELCKISGCFILATNPSVFYKERRLLDYLVELAYSTEQNISNAAHKALRAIITDEANENNEYIAQKFIKSFDKYTPDTVQSFFKVLQTLLENTNKATINLINQIYQFAKNHLSDQSPVISAESIYLLAAIGQIDPISVLEVSDKVTNQCNRLLSSDFSGHAACRIASFFAITKSGEEFLETLQKSFVSNDVQMTNKERIELATQLATMSQNKENIKLIYKFVVDNLQNAGNSEFFYVMSAAVEITKKLEDSNDINQLYQILISLLEKQTDNVKVNAICEVIQVILELNNSIQADFVKKFFEDFLEGKLHIFGGLPLEAFGDGNSILFHLVAQHVEKFPEIAKSLNLAQKVFSVLFSISLDAVPDFLEIFYTCLKTKVLDSAAFSEKDQNSLLELVFPLYTTGEFGAFAINNVIEALIADKDYLKQENIFESLETSIVSFAGSDSYGQAEEQFVHLISLALSVCNKEISEEFSKIIKDYIVIEEIFVNFIKLPARNIKIPQNVVVSMVQIALMSQSELKKNEISTESYNELKNLIQNEISNPETLKAIRNSLGKNKKNTLKFNKLFNVK